MNKVEHIFGIFVGDRIFKTVFPVRTYPGGKVEFNIEEDFNLVSACDVLINLTTNEKLKDRYDLHPVVYKRIFEMRSVVRYTEVMEFVS